MIALRPAQHSRESLLHALGRFAPLPSHEIEEGFVDPLVDFWGLMVLELLFSWNVGSPGSRRPALLLPLLGRIDVGDLRAAEGRLEIGPDLAGL